MKLVNILPLLVRLDKASISTLINSVPLFPSKSIVKVKKIIRLTEKDT